MDIKTLVALAFDPDQAGIVIVVRHDPNTGGAVTEFSSQHVPQAHAQTIKALEAVVERLREVIAKGQA